VYTWNVIVFPAEIVDQEGEFWFCFRRTRKGFLAVITDADQETGHLQIGQTGRLAVNHHMGPKFVFTAPGKDGVRFKRIVGLHDWPEIPERVKNDIRNRVVSRGAGCRTVRLLGVHVAKNQ